MSAVYRSLVGCAAFLVVVGGGVVQGQLTYTLTDLGSFPALADGPRGVADGGVLSVGKTVGGNPRGFYVTSGGSLDIGTLGGAATTAGGVVINTGLNAAQIAGSSVATNGETHAFLWTLGGTGGVSGNPQMKDLGKIGGIRSEGYAVNAAGHVVGYSETAGGGEAAFLYNGTTMIDVGLLIDNRLNLPWSYGYGINSASRIVGSAFDNNFATAVAFSSDGGTVQALGNLGFAWSEAYAINDANQIVGYSTYSDGSEEACIWTGTTAASLGSLGGSSYALAINNAGVVVGGSYTEASDTNYRAFVVESGTMRNLQTLLDSSGQGWTLTEATDVNDAGQIIGTGLVGGVRHGFLLTPVTPSSDIVIDVASGTVTQAQAGYATIAVADSVTKTGVGTVVFDAANAYTGPTTVAAGTLEVAEAQAVGASTVTIDTGATLRVAAGVTMAAPAVIVDGGALAAATLAVTGSGGIGSLAINAGTLSGSPAVTVSGGGEISLPQDARVTAAVGSLSVAEAAGGGRIDLGSGQLTIAAGGISAAALRADILAGRSGGSWSGSSGITSSAAAASGGGRAVGYVVAADGSAKVSFAAAGDIDLSGAVNVFDLVGVNSAGKYGTGTTAAWSQGDFNYDGVTNVFDLVAVGSSGAYGSGNYFPAAPTVAGSAAAVPEPAGTAIIGSCLGGLACGLVRRRQARR